MNRRSKEEAARLANLVATAIIIVVGSVCALGMLAAPGIVHLMAPGFAEVPGKFELAVRMTRIMFPFLLIVALAAQAMGILNASNKFGVPAMASTFFNIGSVVFGIALGIWLGPALHLSQDRRHGHRRGPGRFPATGVAVSKPARPRLPFSRVAFDWANPGLRQILGLMVPAILGNAAVQINVMVNTNFASSVHDPVRGFDGPVSWLSYAFRFMQLPIGLFGVAMGSATLPSISRSAAVGRHGTIPANAVEIPGDGISADGAFFRGTRRPGQVDHRCDLPGRPFPVVRHPTDGAGPVLLRDWPGGLRRR